MVMARTTARGCNVDYPWNEFDPEDYFSHNYVNLRDDDRQIVELVRDYFVQEFAVTPLPPGARGIDVGTGANLYPALTMLPFCEHLTLFEYSTPNVKWLREQQESGWPSWNEAWDQFWTLLCKQEAYEHFPRPKDELTRRAVVEQGNVYELSAAERWDVGTMFFVAESITRQQSEFRSALDHFLDVLEPGAPFAIAFMEHSAGYHVADQHFPATDISRNDVRGCLRDRAKDVTIQHIGPGENPLRDGYSGMLIALGRVNA